MNKTNFHILVVDDEAAQRQSIAGFLKKKEYSVESRENVEQGIAYAAHNPVDLILTDFKMPDGTGEDLLMAVKKINPAIQVIVMTAYGSIESAVKLMKNGAYDYLQKPIELEELLHVIERVREHLSLVSENTFLRQQLAEKFRFDAIISNSGEMEHVLNTAGRVATSKATVLLRGESGTGKELVAHAIHQASDRKDQPFIVVNCAALPETLIDSELFGYEKGAFTGAERRHIGKFEQAHGGTLFIDEVGDIPLALQVKLLRAIQFGQVQRLGGSETLELDVRIVAATNRPLEEMIQQGQFREDLFYRLNVVMLHIPPLRDRRSDIPPLVQAFISRYALQNQKNVASISKEAMDALMRYEFQGNVRELENIIHRAVLLTREDAITTRDLPTGVLSPSVSEPVAATDALTVGDLNEQVESLEKKLITEALRQSQGNQVKAAEMLRISERTLRYKLSKLKL